MTWEILSPRQTRGVGHKQIQFHALQISQWRANPWAFLILCSPSMKGASPLSNGAVQEGALRGRDCRGPRMWFSRCVLSTRASPHSPPEIQCVMPVFLSIGLSSLATDRAFCIVCEKQIYVGQTNRLGTRVLGIERWPCCTLTSLFYPPPPF